MKTLLRLALIGCLLPLTPSTLTADPSDLDRLGPFIDPTTVLIAELNLGTLDLPTSAAALAKLLPEPPALWAKPLEEAQRTLSPWLDEFRQAGGDRLYVLLSLSQLGSIPPVLLVAPTSGATDPNRLQAAFAKINPPWPAQVKQGCVLTAPDTILSQWPAGAPHARVERWKSILQAAPPGVARVVFLPYEESDRVLTDLLPTLPPQLGGGPVSIVSQGLRSAALSLTLPPQGALSLVIQSESPAAAAALRRLLEHGFQSLDQIAQDQGQQAAWQSLRPLLLPTVTDHRLHLRLEFEQVATVVRSLVPTLEEARAKATQITLMNQLKQIGLAMHMHASDHGDRFPAHFVDTLKYLGDDVRLLLHPEGAPPVPPDFSAQSRDAKIAWIDRHTPFVYAPPPTILKDIKSPMTTVLVYERPHPTPGSRLAVLFADGHVEMVAPEKLPDLLKTPSAQPQ